MLLFIPIRTDSPVRRIPHVNHALLLLNVLVYLALNVFGEALDKEAVGGWRRSMMLWPSHPALYQFFTYQFLHDNFWHVAGNMLFLWVFGNSVNAKMGQLPYLLFYLAGGAFAGVGFTLTSAFPCLGASGAIAAVTTAFLVLFPRSEVTTFYWLWFYVGTMHIRALLLIGLKIILWDNIIAPQLSAGPELSSVAYSAHLAGYAFGLLICSGLLLIRALPRDQYDMLALIKRYRQRLEMKAAMLNPDAAARATYGRVALPVARPVGGPADEIPMALAVDDLSQLRGEISDLIAKREYTEAAAKYEELLAKDANQCLPRSNQLLVANQLMTLDRYPQAATAYERFLKTYPNDPDAGQIKLVLGIIYARYLQQYEAAQKYLQECASRLTDPQQVQQAAHWLEEAIAATRPKPSTA